MKKKQNYFALMNRVPIKISSISLILSCVTIIPWYAKEKADQKEKNRYGSQTVLLYSTIRLTSEVSAFTLMLLLEMMRFLFKKPLVLFAFWQIVLICLSYFRSFEMIPQCRKYSSLYRVPRLRSSQIKAERYKKLFTVTVMRHASSNSAENFSHGIPPGYIPDVPDVPSVENLDKIPPLAELNSLGEPTLQSIGLGSNWPTGLLQQALEAIHTGLDVPWWAAISIMVVIIRLVMLPVTIYSRKNIIRHNNVMPELNRIKIEMEEARSAHDPNEANQAAARARKVMADNEVTMKGLLLPILIQIPVFLSMYFAIRGMVEYPVFSMRTGGTLWFEDLTQTGFVLPVICATFLLINLRALVWYWTFTNAFVLGQVLFLKIPVIKTALGMPEEIKHEKQPQELNKYRRSFLQSLKNSVITYQKQSEMQQRKAVDSTEFRGKIENEQSSWTKTQDFRSGSDHTKELKREPKNTDVEKKDKKKWVKKSKRSPKSKEKDKSKKR